MEIHLTKRHPTSEVIAACGGFSAAGNDSYEAVGKLIAFHGDFLPGGPIQVIDHRMPREESEEVAEL
jgi:hypothetical protein